MDPSPNIGALRTTYTILGVPHYNYSRLYPKTLFLDASTLTGNLSRWTVGTLVADLLYIPIVSIVVPFLGVAF